MKRIIDILLIFSVFAFVYTACEAPKVFPDTPEVSFKSVSLENAVDSLQNQVKRVKLTIHVADGDGDIGIIDDYGNIYPTFINMDSVDLYIDLLQKVDGVFEKVNLFFPYNYATPYLEPQGQNKTLIVDLEVSFDITEQYDTIKYSFYIYDRALHKSNVAESPEIPFDTLGTIYSK